ncbi:MAG: Radical domain protein [Clostridiales bacterium]|jgi:methylornithine synthase|nr:Radical domain protein [Clostridiales bacterium]
MAYTCKTLVLDEILEKADKEIPLSKEEIVFLLCLSDKKEIKKVNETACKLRKRYFGNKIFFYGFVYFSTYCKNDCAFCFYRKSNTKTIRYRKKAEEIVETAKRLADSGVHLLDLTMGEDPVFFSDDYKGFEGLLDIIRSVKDKTGLPVMISPGVVPEELLRKFKEAGVDWYACYQETHNKKLYEKMRLYQSYELRLLRKKTAQKMGFLIEEGILTGIGDTSEDVANSFEIMKDLNADQVRVMSFVPQKGTPMDGWSTPTRLRELLIIAAMRLVFPDRLIPASLDVDGLKGLRDRLLAGANVVTSIIPPRAGFAGVSQSSLDIEEGNRTVNGALPVLKNCGLIPADKIDYISWIRKRQEQNRI